MQQSFPKLMNPHGWLYLVFIVVLSAFTYVSNFHQPEAVFWDEPYHIAAAQKYLHGVHFMEQHPPLGKLLIALGEKLVGRNAKSDQFLDTDYARNFPQGFSFFGYRLIPVLLAWLTAPLLFFIFLLLVRNASLATLLSFLYVFDNALIVHNRGAMLDGPLLFFSSASILLFLLLLEFHRQPWRLLCLAFLFGVALGAVTTTKLTGLVLVLLVPFLLIRLAQRNLARHEGRKRHIRDSLARLVPATRFLLPAAAGFVLTFVAVWQTHFALGTKVFEKLNSSGYYQASEQYKRILAYGGTSSLLSFPVMLRDSIRYVTHYNNGVPRLDLCKADENGSPFYLWPFGTRAVNYRWEQAGTDTYRYLYLQVNPVVWLTGLVGILVCISIIVAHFLLPLAERPKHLFLIAAFLTLYVSYMLAVSMIDRVMYLYHYFLPLIFSFILFALAFLNVQRIWRWKLGEHLQVFLLTLLGGAIFASYQFYRPFTYYLPMTNAAFERRSLLPLWELKCVNCPKVSGLVVPCR